MTSEIIVRKANHEYKYLDPALQTESLEAAKAKMLQGAFSPLSADRESGVFLLFLLGDDIETVSLKAGIPKDVIVATADKYDWEKKKSVFEGKDADTVKGLQKSIVSMILAATYVSVKAEMEKVLAGTLDPKESTFVPTSINGIQKLVSLMAEINGMAPLLPGGMGSGNTAIQAQNVQILQQVNPSQEGAEAKELSAQERSAFLKALAESGKR